MLRNGKLYDIELSKERTAQAAMVIRVRVDAKSRFLMGYETLRAFCSEWHLMEGEIATRTHEP